MKPKASPDEPLSLIRLLNSANSDTRLEALGALLKRGKPYSLIAARALCQDSNETARNEAVEALGLYGNRRQDLRRLTTAIQDSSWVVRSTATEGLGIFGGTTAFKILCAALYDPHEIVRRDAAGTLGKYGEMAVSTLEDARLREKNELALIGIHYGLFRTGKKEALLTYLGFLRSENSLARNNVINGVNPEDMTRQEVNVVRDTITAHVQSEDHPGCRGDALDLLEFLQEWSTGAKSD